MFYSQGKIEKGSMILRACLGETSERAKSSNLHTYTLCSLDFLAPILKLLDEGVSPPTDINGKPLGLEEFFVGCGRIWDN